MNLQTLLKLPKRATQKRYDTIKYITITYGAVNGVLDLYIAFLIGAENYLLAFILLGVSIILTLVDSVLWVWCLEQMSKKKIEYGRRQANGKASKKNK
jgi:hypothetical protein